jgi:hypothetical protein
VVVGGAGVSGNIYSGSLYTSGLYWANNNQSITGPATGTNGSLQFNNSGVAGGTNAIYDSVTGNIVFTDATNSTSTTTGALVLSGGLGVAGNVFASGLNGTIYGTLFIGTTGVNYNRSSAAQTLTGIAIDGTAGTATNAINTQVTSNISSGTAYVTFVSATSGNAAQNINTALTYNPNSGNLRAYGVLTDTGIYWAGNGAAFSSAPGGTTGQLQYNNSNQFTGANIVFNNANGNLVITSTTTSTSTTTGALVVNGGVGIAGVGIIGGNIVAAATTTSTSTTTGAIVSRGGVGISGALFNGGVHESTGNIVAAATTTSTSTTTGALVVRGGAGIAGTITSTAINMDNGLADGAGIKFQSSGFVEYEIDNSSGAFRIFQPGVLRFTVDRSGNVGVANTAPLSNLSVTGTTWTSGNINTGGWIIPTSNVSQNLGSTTAWWNVIYGVSQQARYADLAENYTADQDYAPGTVVVFGGEKEVTTTTVTHDTRVAGVISTNPGYLMNAASEGLPVAFTGRVPCQVRGPVNKGTVLVTSNTPGVAEAINFSMFRPGCVLGKSLEDITNNDIKTIEVVVGRF